MPPQIQNRGEDRSFQSPSGSRSETGREAFRVFNSSRIAGTRESLIAFSVLQLKTRWQNFHGSTRRRLRRMPAGVASRRLRRRFLAADFNRLALMNSDAILRWNIRFYTAVGSPNSLTNSALSCTESFSRTAFSILLSLMKHCVCKTISPLTSSRTKPCCLSQVLSFSW